MPNKNNYYGKGNDGFDRDVPPDENYYADGSDYIEGGVNPTDYYRYSKSEIDYNIQSFSQERQRKSNAKEPNHTPEKNAKEKRAAARRNG